MKNGTIWAYRTALYSSFVRSRLKYSIAGFINKEFASEKQKLNQDEAWTASVCVSLIPLPWI